MYVPVFSNAPETENESSIWMWFSYPNEPNVGHVAYVCPAYERDEVNEAISDLVVSPKGLL
jgi:hypothetical protein